MKFENANVLITGGASGIGKIMGRMALEKGASCLIIWDINPNNIQITEKELGQLGMVKGYVVDVSDNKLVTETYLKVVNECGDVDILINNAAIQTEDPLFETTIADFRRVVDTNLIGTFMMCSVFERDMKEHDTILNMLQSLNGMGDAEYEMGRMAPPEMIVITNQLGVNGAAAFFYPDSMDKISEQLGGNFFMLPSSIHEVIAVPTGDKDYRDLESMVKQINMMQVAKEEQLSDHVYHYDAKEKIFELASKHDERLHGRDKESLLGRLAEKKKEAAVLNDASPAKHKTSERAM